MKNLIVLAILLLSSVSVSANQTDVKRAVAMCKLVRNIHVPKFPMDIDPTTANLIVQCGIFANTKPKI